MQLRANEGRTDGCHDIESYSATAPVKKEEEKSHECWGGGFFPVGGTMEHIQLSTTLIFRFVFSFFNKMGIGLKDVQGK